VKLFVPKVTAAPDLYLVVFNSCVMAHLDFVQASIYSASWL